MQLNIMDLAPVKGRNEPIDLVNEMVNLALEHGNTCQDEMALIRVPHRAGGVQVEQVHVGRPLWTCLDKRKSGREEHLAPADRDTHSPTQPLK